MTVAKILELKGSDVVTIEPNATLEDATRSLTEHRIGAVVVTGADGQVAGILSERDIVRTIATHGASTLDVPVASAMTRSVVTCQKTDTINSVMERMSSGRFRHMPVLSNGRLSGIVSVGDVVKHRIAEVLREAEEMRSYIAAG